MPKVSVIVPVYNTERYLNKCIDSILSQSFTDFELLLINDGSKDNSGAICDQYAANDLRVKVFHKENGGVSSARNLGLDNARGEWVTFVDSDDWIYSNTLSSLIDESQFVDMAIGAMSFENGGCIMCLCEENRTLVGRDLELIIQNNMNDWSFNSPCAKVFRRQIIQDIALRFDEALCFGEDSLFVKEYLLNVKKINVIHNLCYHYCDSGEGVYNKYSKNFKPIYLYYVKMISMYDKMSDQFDIQITNRDLVGVIFNIALNCIFINGVKEYCYVRKFLIDNHACFVLKRRASKYLNIILYLAKFPYGLPLVIFVRFVENFKTIINKISYNHSKLSC